MSSLTSRRPYALFLLGLVMLVPLALPLGTVGDKPVDLVYSDLLLPMAVIYFFLRITSGLSLQPGHRRLLMVSFLVSLYFLLVSIVGGLVYGDFLVRILSALRFIKPFLFCMVAYMAYRVIRPSLEAVFISAARVSVLLVVVLLVSDVLFNPNFPSSRWGGSILGADVYGFPNSPAVFYSFYIFFCVLAIHLTKRYYFLAGVLGALLLVIFSFSRSGWLTAIIILGMVGGISGIYSLRALVRYLLLITIVLTVFWIYFDDIMAIVEPWMYKVDTISGKDVTLSGRREIWDYTLDLIARKPFFGYGFEPFSHYMMDYDTPHEQYLEVAYKAGIVGLALYLYYFFWLFMRSVGRGLGGMARLDGKIIRFYFVALMLAIFASNFAQPSISYSVLGNALVFYLCLIYFIVSGKDGRGNEAASAASR